MTAIVDADDYAMVLGELRAGGTVAPATRFRLAVKAFEHTARATTVRLRTTSAHGAAPMRRRPRFPAP